MTPRIDIRRVFAPPSPADGVRILVDALWPRGFAKATAPWSDWARAVAPSPAIRKRFHADGDYAAFRASYLAELSASPAADAFRKRLAGLPSPILLLFAAKNEAQNNAAVLREWLAGD